MRAALSAIALALAFQGPEGVAPPAGDAIETRSIQVQLGDTFAIKNDLGKIRIRSWEGATLEVAIQKTAPDPGLRCRIGVAVERSPKSIAIAATFSGSAGEAVDFDIKAPAFLNITIAGAKPDVSIAGIRGSVRVQNAGGRITVENLTSAVSLVSETAEIIYRCNVQPREDTRLESVGGNVYAELEVGLNLQIKIRAGGKIFWDMDPMVESTSLEKHLGAVGPQLRLDSQKGNVVVRLKPKLNVPAALTSTQASPAVESAARNPENDPVMVKPSQPEPAAAPAASPTPPAGRSSSASVSRQTERQVSDANPRRSAPGAVPESPAPVTRQEKASAGEEEKPQPRQEDYSLKVNVDSVFLNVSVLDRGTNRSIAGLNKQDFRIHEDGVLQQVDQFHPSEAPFNLLLLLDVSGSTQSFIDLMRIASVDFIRQIKPNDRIAVATFNSNVQLIQGFTNDRAAAEQAIMRIWPGGGTAFYDALMTSVNQYMQGVEGRSAIVVFTDGVDNQLFGDRVNGSRSTFDELYRRIQEVDSLVYTIILDTEGQYPSTTRGPGGTNTTGAVIDILGGVLGRGRYPGTYPDPRGYPYPRPSPTPYPTPSPYPSPNPSPSPGPYPSPSPYPGPSTYPRSASERAAYIAAREQLMMIADQTGGRMYSPYRIDELSRVFAQIAQDLRVQYQLGYNSTNRARDGRWRQIQVMIDRHPEAVVRTRKGYYSR